MPYIKEIVALINTNLKASTLSDKRFDKGAFLGVAKLLTRMEDDNKKTTIPAIVNNNGTCSEVIINDIKPFWLYHRINDISFSDSNNSGDERIRVETVTMYCLVYADRNIIKLEEEEIVSAIDAGFLTHLTSNSLNTYNLQNVSITINKTNLNSEQVYSQEYSGNVEYILKPNNMFASLEYTIVAEYDKSCVDIC